MIYLDNNATTPLAPEVRAAILPYLDTLFANPSSAHGPGMAVREALAEARAAVAALLGARPADLVFTASATEANHLAILGALGAMERAGSKRRHLVTTAVEHPSTLMLFRELERQGWYLTVIPVDAQGRIDLSFLEQAVSAATALVSVMWANNETGVVMPVAEAAAVARARGALFHTDAVQAVGRVPVAVDAAPIDLLTLSGHKLHAPKGTGALYVRPGVELLPLVLGHQEQRRRGGTENVPGIIGLGVAARLAAGALAGAAGLAALRDRLERGVRERLPGCRIHGQDAARLPNTSNIGFLDEQSRPVEAEALLTWLDRAGIQVSMGAACAAGTLEPSHVLLAQGLSRAEALGSLRFSLSRYTTAEEVDALLDALPPLFARLAA